tara:strand:+ start:341 stop:1201 length:861 start_codon:yes stop_codon:yes gene_type:complete
MTSGVIDNSKNDIWYFLSAPFALFVLNGFGWTIRFIIEGKVNFIPFNFKSISQVPLPSWHLFVALIIISGFGYFIERAITLQKAKNAEIEATLAVQESEIRLNQARINRVEADERAEKLEIARSERIEKERRRSAEANKLKEWRSLQCNVHNTLKVNTNAPSAFSFIFKKREASEVPEVLEWLDYSNGVGIMRTQNLQACYTEGALLNITLGEACIFRVGNIFKFRLDFTDWSYKNTDYSSLYTRAGRGINEIMSLNLKNYTYVLDGIASGKCYDRDSDSIRRRAN